MGILAGAGAANLMGHELPWSVVAAGTALGVVGLADDVYGLGATVRLTATTIVAVGFVGTVDLPGAVTLGGSLVLALALVGFVNAFNFMDGINSISVLHTLVVTLWLAMASRAVDPGLALLTVVTGAAVVGFAPFNVPGARLFLGDVGSYGLGIVLSGSALVAWSAGVPTLVALAPFVIYTADTGATLARRALRRERLVTAHREHVYQRLVDYGLTDFLVAAVTAAFSILCCLLAILPAMVTVPGWVLVVGLYLALPWAVGRRLTSSLSEDAR